MAKKKWKLVGLDKVLESAPAKERADLAAEIADMFKDFEARGEAFRQAVRRKSSGG